ncbi:MAG TPA: putative glycolipid-binding domain-containing protein [Thermoanaerobaculia bacterium]|nr:putative glycolipid-binding domain-containing protein [Thermoanaerobaculia bacterium]
MKSTTVVWTRIDVSGHDAARLDEGPHLRELTGSAVFVENALPVSLDYRIVCGADWHTRTATVRGWIGTERVTIALAATESRWTLNGATRPAVDGCVDLDLNFSPSTNLLPVRRLALATGESAVVRSAWLRFPSLELEPLEQTYRRVSEQVYEYETDGFRARLTVDETGFPIEYGGLWRAIASARHGPSPE